MGEREIVGSDGVRWRLTRDGSRRYPWRLTDGHYETFARNLDDARRIIELVEYCRARGTIALTTGDDRP
jgi:hypothetical protein